VVDESEERKEQFFMKRVAVLFMSILLALLFAVSSGAAQEEKIFVSADGDSASAMVSSVAARGPFFILFDGDGKFLEAMANPHKDADGKTSGLVVELLAARGAKVIIAGHFGGKMVTALKEKGIVRFEHKGSSAADAVKKYLERKANPGLQK
jgi:predicted Fe-Mo cluster-binding NifX family protein